MATATAATKTPTDAGEVKVALVTGAAIRVGRSIALALHKEGYNVILHCNTSIEQANQLRDMMNSARSGSAHVLQADLSRNTASVCKKLIESGVQVFGRLDVLVNSASSFVMAPLGSITEDNWASSLDTNVKAPVFLAQAAVPYLRAVRGNIVNMTDMLGEHTSPSCIAHCISKAALISATKSLAQAAAPEVRVNAVSPGAVEWPEKMNEKRKEEYIAKTPLARVGTPQETADAVVFLASERASFITGQVLGLDGGRGLHF
uniref:Pteridine reductase 1-like n=1 Tax=Hirondellea gigas TaxID=1518452 RepID=A0A6A7G4V4_9CRUS